MRTFNEKEFQFSPGWSESIKSFFKDTFRSVYVILNPFIQVADNYNKGSIEHNVWAGENGIDYPTDSFILGNCFEIKWSDIIDKSKLNSITEINHALINNALKSEYTNDILEGYLYEYCDSNLIYYPVSGEISSFNVSKCKKLLIDLGLNEINIFSEFGDKNKRLSTATLDTLINNQFHVPSLMSADKNILITNDWESYMTILATNYPLDINYLKSYGFEILEPDDDFKLNCRVK